MSRTAKAKTGATGRAKQANRTARGRGAAADAHAAGAHTARAARPAPGHSHDAAGDVTSSPEPGGGHAPHRLAHGVEPALQAKALARLRRIEGQVRGLQRMVDEGRYCADILTQLSSVQEALRGVGKLLMRNHLQHCVTAALRSGDRLDAEQAYAEVLDLMYTHAR